MALLGEMVAGAIGSAANTHLSSQLMKEKEDLIRDREKFLAGLKFGQNKALADIEHGKKMEQIETAHEFDLDLEDISFENKLKIAKEEAKKGQKLPDKIVIAEYLKTKGVDESSINNFLTGEKKAKFSIQKIMDGMDEKLVAVDTSDPKNVISIDLPNVPEVEASEGKEKSEGWVAKFLGKIGTGEGNDIQDKDSNRQGPSIEGLNKFIKNSSVLSPNQADRQAPSLLSPHQADRQATSVLSPNHEGWQAPSVLSAPQADRQSPALLSSHQADRQSQGEQKENENIISEKKKQIKMETDLGQIIGYPIKKLSPIVVKALKSLSSEVREQFSKENIESAADELSIPPVKVVTLSVSNEIMGLAEKLSVSPIDALKAYLNFASKSTKEGIRELERQQRNL